MSALKPQAESGMATLKKWTQYTKTDVSCFDNLFLQNYLLMCYFLKLLKTVRYLPPPLLSLSAKVFYRFSYFKKFKKYPSLFSEE